MPRQSRTSSPDSLSGAQQRALRLLARREHSIKELCYKLESRGVPAQLADAVVRDFERRGWQSDARYAESMMRTRLAGGYGPLRVRAELSAAGLSDALISSVLQNAACDWDRLAQEAYKRRFPGGPESPEEWQRGYRFLAQRGFSAEQIHAALKSISHDDKHLP